MSFTTWPDQTCVVIFVWFILYHAEGLKDEYNFKTRVCRSLSSLSGKFALVEHAGHTENS